MAESADVCVECGKPAHYRTMCGILIPPLCLACGDLPLKELRIFRDRAMEIRKAQDMRKRANGSTDY